MAMPIQAILPIPALSDNYIWLVRHGDRAVVVDPGESAPVIAACTSLGVTVDAILLTHHHGDHVGGVTALIKQYGCKVWGPATEQLPHCDVRVKAGDQVTLPALDIALKVIDVPGHTAGHIAYAGRAGGAEHVVFSGDTLFAGGCGRLFEGTPAQMLGSLDRLESLPLETSVFCGHEYTLANLRWALAVESDNPALQDAYLRAQTAREHGHPTLPSSIERERQTNPFLRTRRPEVIAAASQWAGRQLESPVDVFAALREWKNQFK